jgi:phage minor structural protein
VYKVTIINNGIATVIHYPISDYSVPHLDNLPLKEALSTVDSLSFNIYTNNPGYSLLFELTTKIKVIDTRDNSVRFTGRVLDVNERMDGKGLFYKEVLCEGALSYLNDSKQRVNAFANENVTSFLTQILAIHNGKVDSGKQIQIGNIDVVGSVAYSCNFETTLAAILAVKEKLGGDIRVREEIGILYFDWLQSFSINTVDVTLGTNMKDMIKGKDVTSLGTRIIPLGANNLTISSVNDELDYIEDGIAKNVYGVIEKTVEYKDITNATELYNTCLADLNKYTQPLFLLESSTLDLSYLTGNESEQFILGTDMHIVNPVMAIDAIYKVVQIDLDLLKPYDPKLTIANFPIKLSTSINDLRKNTISNNGVYNNVQIGDAFGIRAVRSDSKVITTINATEGISIENENKKVFYVDTNGNLVAVDISAENMKAEGGTFKNIITENMIAKEMKTSNTVDYIILHDKYMDFYHNNHKIMSLGFFNATGSYGSIYGPDGILIETDTESILMGGGIITVTGLLDVHSNIKMNSETVATQSWASNNFAIIGHYHSEFDGIGTNLNTLNSQVYDLQSRVSALENA